MIQTSDLFNWAMQYCGGDAEIGDLHIKRNFTLSMSGRSFEAQSFVETGEYGWRLASAFSS